MLKKVMSAVLAGVMTLALAVPAFASSATATNATNPVTTTPTSSELSSDWYGGDHASSGIYDSSDANGNGLQEGEFETVYTSQTKVPYLDVVITGNGGLILNPYRVAYTAATAGWGGDPSAAWDLTANAPSSVSATPPSSAATETTTFGAEQVISTDITITSTTIVPVLVGAKVKVVVDQGNKNAATADKVVLSSAAIVAADQAKSTKKVCLWLGAGENHNAAMLNGRNATNTKAAADSFNCKNWLLCSLAWGDTASTQKWNENQRIFMIPKSTGASDKQTCVLTFGGQMVQQPLNNPWVPGDKVTPTLVINLQVQKNYDMPVYQ